MASYSAEALSGAGTPIEALSGTKTFSLVNPLSSSGYFTIETTRNNDGFYSGSSTNALGTYSSFTGIDADTLVTSSYIASVVVPSGNSSFQFAPTTAIAASGSNLRATGGISLTIT